MYTARTKHKITRYVDGTLSVASYVRCKDAAPSLPGHRVYVRILILFHVVLSLLLTLVQVEGYLFTLGKVNAFAKAFDRHLAL
jgi:hypothetical protein